MNWLIAYMLFLGITTVYGFIMYKRGQKHGARELAQLCVDAKLVKSYAIMQERINDYYNMLQEKRKP